MARRNTNAGERDRDLGRTVMVYGAGLVVAIVLAMFLSALLPRWWAQRVGNVVDGRITLGSLLGFGVGVLGAFLALLLVRWVWTVRHQKAPAVFLLVLAAVVAFPSLMTLWVVWGTSSAAHAGERILDVDGPGYRGGTLIGAVVGVALFLFVTYRTWRRERQRRRLRHEGIEREREEAVPPPPPPPPPEPPPPDGY